MSSSCNNVKIHFVLSDGLRFAAILRAADVHYSLFSCYNYIRNKNSSQDMKLSQVREDNSGFKHVIMDSGLFTMMFGADNHAPKTPEFMREWMHRICKFASQNKIKASIVECDCQKLISPEFAWELRQEMKTLLPNNEIINVFHLEDGEQGFKRLVDFSDYIAISVPELRIAQPKNYRNTVCSLSRLARKQKPEIKIHLLGCTQKDLLQNNRFCTSADSSSWTSGVRYGSFDKDHHIRSIKEEKRLEAITKIKEAAQELNVPIGSQHLQPGSKGYDWMTANYYAAIYHKENYIKWAGSQE